MSITPQNPIRSELERYAERLFDCCKKGMFAEMHTVLMKSKSWMEYEEATPEEAGFWIGVLAAAPHVCPNREATELLRRYKKELCQSVTDRRPVLHEVMEP